MVPARSCRGLRAALVLLWLAALPSAALAHATLVASTPANDAVLATAPATLALTFNEPVDPLALRIVDASGRATSITQIEQEGNRLILTPPAALGEGAHVLSWRVMSTDGHPASGSLTFWIGSGGIALPEIAVSVPAPRRAAIWIARLAIYLGLLVGVGGAFFRAWVEVSASTRAPALGCAVASLIGLASVVVSVGLQGLDVTDLPLRDLGRGVVWTAGVQGSFGWSAGIAVAALLLGLAAIRFDGTPARALSLTGLIGVGAALAASGHAAAASPRYLTVASVFLHGVGVAFWIGALLPLGFALRAGTDQAMASLTRFSSAIPFAVAALLVSGTALAVVQLETLTALWSTSYGWVLCAKLALVLLLFALALWNRRLTPRVIEGSAPAGRALRRSIGVELALVVAILGVVALWRFTPPPRALTAGADNFFTHLHAERAMANVTIIPGHAGPIEITIQLETPDEAPLVAQALTVTLSNPTVGIEPATVEAQGLGPGQWRVRMAAPVPGRWTLELGILISDFDQVTIEAPILIR
ncbi:FixH family protein [Rhodopseudomonas sp.]|uniref:copper resistance CopC/CopD family protein n=1 Tax=Rhodopseudomonas sp. TaxID=1078 RepID=UPI0025CFB95E|nr:FixH family protein [Rhodopseudomonas sp.]